MSDPIMTRYRSRLDDPKTWGLDEDPFEFKNAEEAKRAEKFFNEKFEQAHRSGVIEGLEEAAKIAEESQFNSDTFWGQLVAEAIRQRIEEMREEK